MFRLTIKMTSSNAVPSPNWGTLMHGMLIEHLRGAWPFLLHEDQGRPITQWVEPVSTTQLNWHVQMMEDSLAVSFLESCQKGDQWYCQHNGSRLAVEEIKVEQDSLSDYVNRKLTEGTQVSDITIQFKTTTTHKSQGKYVLFPTVELIANSLRNRLSEADESLTLPDEKLKLLTEHTQIHQYQLRSALFGLEGSWVKGYTGQVTLRISGPEPILRFGNLLFGLAPWFGVGIKTTLGMGGCVIPPWRGRETH